MANDKRFITKNGLDANSNTIINVSTPSNSSDAATKGYVDSITTDISGDTGTDAITLGTDTLAFAGTTNEIVTAVTDNTVTISLPDNVTIGDSLTVTGNLTVNGTTTTINSTTLTVDDLNVVVASGAADASAANGAGLTVDGASATITYASTGDKWVFNKDGDFGANDVTAATFIGDVTGNADTASAWATSRTITLGGVLSGNVSIDGSSNVTLTAAHTSDPTITLTGDVTGSATMTNLGNVSISTTVAANSVALGTDTTGNYVDNVTGGNGITVTGSAGEGWEPAIAVDLTDTNTFTSTNTASRAVVRDGSGDFSAGTITAALSGNAATATALETARDIGGVSFDGTANINLPGVNTTGNQDTTGNAATATALETARDITLTGDVTGSASFDGTANVSITATIADDSHNHTIANVDGLQSALDAKAALAGATFTGDVAGTNLTLSGNLTVNGTTTTVNTTNTVVSDNLIELNNGATSNANDLGIVMERGSTGDNAFMGWDESVNKFIVGTTTATGSSTGDLTITKGTLLADVEGDVTGNAATATALETARTIGGVSFDGTANINLPGVNTTGNQDTTGNADTATALETARTIGGVSFDGTANINLPGVNTTGNQDTTGNADTATALETARDIGGVSFDGTANINLPGVNTSGNQDTTGNAATATALETARDIALTGDVTGSASFDGTGNISITATVADDSHNHVVGNIDGIQEYIQDTAGAMWSSNSESGVSVVYQDTDGTLDINVNDPTITLTGDVTGSATMTNLGNVSITATVADDSHNHVISNVDGLQSALDAKAALAGATFTGDVTGTNLTLSGNLTVNGTTTTLNTTNTVVSDNLIELNNGATSNANDSGIVIERGSTGDNAFMGWDESTDKFIVGTTTATGSSTGNLTITKGTLLANVEGNVTGDVTGNADTATSLETARDIGGVSFDGTANINLPGVNTSGNQDTSGNAATATKWATARTITLGGVLSGNVSIDGSSNVTLTAAHTSDPTITLTGDVTGSATMTNLGNVSISTTVASNSVALGTDTTGNYVDNVTGGNGISVTGSAGEGWEPAIAVDLTDTNTFTSTNTASRAVVRDASSNFSAGTITAELSGNASTATALETARDIALTGDVTGSASFDGTANVSITATIADDSHNHVISNVDGLQDALDDKAALAGATFTGDVAGTNLTLSGNLTVNGTTTTVNTTNTVVSDNLIELNNGASTNANDLGIVMERGSTGDNAFMGWDESVDKFIVGTTTATGSSTGNLTITAGTLVASTFEGNVTGDLTGNADTATALETARTIGGVSFDGTANINLPGVNTTGNQDTTGNAATATALETARTIGGVSFDGTANINLPGVNTTGNQDTTGNADTATKWATARTITLGGVLSGNVSIDGSGDVTLTAAHTSDPTITLTGDVTGSATMTNLGNVSISTTVAANSVALGTDTTGNYVDNVTGGNGISVTGSAGEGWEPAIAVDLTDTNTFTSTNTASKAVVRDASGDFAAGTITADLSGNASTANAWSSARTITLGGVLSGNVSIDGSSNVTLTAAHTSDPTITLTGDVTGSATMTNLGNVSITATVADDSHNHIISNVDGLQSALDAKAPLASPALTGTPTAPTAAGGTNTTQVATTAFVTGAISDLVDGAPLALDTLNELAAAINDDASFASTVSTALDNRLSSTATVTLTGDVTGTANFSANTATISATIAANSVALGTDTTGNYVDNVTGGNGISVTGSAGEGWEPAIAVDLTDTNTFTSTNTASKAVVRDASGDFAAGTITADLSGNVTGNVTGDLTGNADTASAWATARTITLGGVLSGNVSIDGSSNVTLTAAHTADPTITLTGDVTGSATMTNLGNVSISTTVAANSVALGTDTTGNYVQQGATSGNGISGSVNSEGGTFTVTSNATSANTASTIVFRDASGDFSAGTITATTTQAQYADLAENYTADAEYAPGTVVSFGGAAEVTVSDADMDRKVAGVVSTDPAHLMNSNLEAEHVVALALQGRVPCKVVGAVEKGDLMVAAGNGFARAEEDPKVGTVIGKALEAHAGGEGVIEVAVGRF